MSYNLAPCPAPADTSAQLRPLFRMPKTTSGKIIRRMLRKIAGDSYEDIGDTTSLAEPEVIGKIIEGHRNLVAGRHETESVPEGAAETAQV